MNVRTGLERVVEDRPDLVRGSRVALLAHAASVDRHLAHAAVRLSASAGARVVRLLAPEHGVSAAAQDMVAVDEQLDPILQLPVVSLYGEDESSLAPPREALEDVDVVVADLVDVGSRYYTFAASVVRTLGVAASLGRRVLVTDRPNPIAGHLVEGPAVSPGWHSFVGELSVSTRHGMTVGELCLLARARRFPDAELEVVTCEGWRRDAWWDETGLPWVQPSPNMPTVETAAIYPGACLLEGTNLSEGRGTTRPFELVGAPWLDARALAETLNAQALPGVAFRPVCFVPQFQKHAGQVCHGVQIHLTRRSLCRPVLTGWAVLIAARDQDSSRFAWRTEPYEFESERLAIDLLAGSSRVREAVEAGASAREIEAGWQPEQAEFERERASFLLY